MMYMFAYWWLNRIRLQCRSCRFHLWVRKIPWRKKWQPAPVFLLGKIPWTEEPGKLESKGSQRVRHNIAAKQQMSINWHSIDQSWPEGMLCLTNIGFKHSTGFKEKLSQHLKIKKCKTEI